MDRRHNLIIWAFVLQGKLTHVNTIGKVDELGRGATTVFSAGAGDNDLLLSGHTHGGQICLPGGIPLTLDATLPRLRSGAWKYRDMAGYTSVGAGSSVIPVRFNCPPEITLHYLRSAGKG